MSEKRVRWWPSFFPGGPVHGGAHRSAQIGELLGELGIAADTLPNGFDLPRARYPSSLARRVLRTGASFPGPAGLGTRARDWHTLHALRGSPRDGVVVWETTGRPELAGLMRARGQKLIAVPHNVESLVPYTRLGGRGWFRFLRREMDALSDCEMVLTISSEEAWFLSLFGVDAHWLPYLPPTAMRGMLDDLAARRAERSAQPDDPWLILGSCNNPPTRAGVERLLAAIADSRDLCRAPIAIVGAETERLSVPANLVGARVYGIVDDRTLDDLRVRCRALLVCQAPTSGVLTRVVESVMAGVPVVTNREGARGWIGLDGVHVYDSLSELPELLAAVPSEVPAVDVDGLARMARDAFASALEQAGVTVRRRPGPSASRETGRASEWAERADG